MIRISRLFATRGSEASLSEQVSKRSVARLAGVAAAGLAAMVALNNAAASEYPKIARPFAARGSEASLSERLSRRSVARLARVAAARLAAMAIASDEYPVVFSSYDAVEPLGISLDYERPLQNKCYHYGSGGVSVF